MFVYMIFLQADPIPFAPGEKIAIYTILGYLVLIIGGLYMVISFLQWLIKGKK